MTNIDKIRKEIERLYDEEAPKHDQQCEFEDGYFTGIATISKFIDSLPEEKPSLTWEDIRRIVNIADALLDDPKARIAIQNHSEEEYYQKVLDEYNKDVSKVKPNF